MASNGLNFRATESPRTLEREGARNRVAAVPQQVAVLANTATVVGTFARPGREENGFEE